jgi:hypothetical protein
LEVWGIQIHQTSTVEFRARASDKAGSVQVKQLNLTTKTRYRIDPRDQVNFVESSIELVLPVLRLSAYNSAIQYSASICSV